MKLARLPRESEAGFTAAVLALARVRGWKALHLRPAMTRAGRWVTAVQGDGVGWPDLFLCRGKRLVAAELKVGRNAPTAEQAVWLALLAAAGVETAVWYPRQWAEIEEALA